MGSPRQNDAARLAKTQYRLRCFLAINVFEVIFEAMHLDSRSLICGYPALDIRKVLRSTNTYDLRDEYLADLLKIPAEAAIELRERLLAEGLIKRSESFGPRWEAYVNTSRGNRIASANALPQIRRSTAERLVAGLVARLRELESHPKFVLRVAEAVVFGSYARGADPVSDVDIGYTFVGRGGTKEADFELQHTRINTVRQYRQFRNLADEYLLPENEVLIFLRNRSGYLSFHRMDRDGEAEIIGAGNPIRIYPGNNLR
jgi:hypothetical protein